MKKIFIILILYYISILFSDNISFSDTTYTRENFIAGTKIKNSKTSLFADSIFNYPNYKSLNPDSTFSTYKYYFIILYSPYPCSDCYHANFNIVNYFAKKYPNQVYFLVEYWNLRDVRKALEQLNLNNNINILLDEEGKDIFKLSTLDDDFINAGFLIIDNKSNINYILMGSFKYPYSKKSLDKLSLNINNYLKQ